MSGSPKVSSSRLAEAHSRVIRNQVYLKLLRSRGVQGKRLWLLSPAVVTVSRMVWLTIKKDIEEDIHRIRMKMNEDVGDSEWIATVPMSDPSQLLAHVTRTLRKSMQKTLTGGRTSGKRSWRSSCRRSVPGCCCSSCRRPTA